MTVTSQTRTASLACDGITTSWPLSWGFDHPKDLVAELVQDGERTALVWPADFAAVPGPGEAGTFTTTTTHPSGAVIEVERRTVAVQERSISSKARLDLEGVERGLDRLTFARIDEQALRTDGLARALRIPVTELGEIAPLPGRQARRNRMLGFDDDGNPAVGDDVIVGAGEWGGHFGLPQEDGVDIAPQLGAIMAERQAAGITVTRYVPRQGEPLPYINSFLRVPAGHTFDRSQAVFRRGRSARIGMSGGLVELPEVGKFRLAAPIAAGATTIFLRVPVGGSIEPLQDAAAAGMDLVLRGENDGGGHSFTVESIGFAIVDDSDDQNIEVLLSEPTEHAYLVVYPDSAWQPQGPASDYTLVSFAVGAVLAAPALAGDIVIELASIPTGLASGRTVVLRSDELVPSGTSVLPFGLEVHRVRSIAGNFVTLTEPVERDFPLDQAPRLLLRRPFAGAKILCGHRQDIWVEAPAPAPARRIDGYTMQYVDDCTIVEPWVDDAATEHFIRGAGVLDRQGYNNRVVDARLFRRPGAGSGDQNGIARYNSAFGRDERSFIVGASNGIINQGGYSGGTWDYVAVDCGLAWDTHGCGHVGAILDGFEVVGGTALSANQLDQRGVEVGNPSHRARDRRTTIRNGIIRGFSNGAAAGLVIRPAAAGVLVEAVALHHCVTGVRVIVDDRAAQLTVDDVVLDGVTIKGCASGLRARGRPAAWEAAATVAGTIARPVWKEASGALWSTTTTGTTGTEEPDAGEDPVIGVTTASDGEIVWTYRGPAGRQIIRMKVRATISGALQAMDLEAVEGLEILESSIAGDAGIALTDAPATLLRNVQAKIAADGPWLVDGGGNDATVIAWPEVGASGIDETGGSALVIRTGGNGGGGGEIPAGTNALVARDSGGGVALRTLEADSLEIVGAELRGRGLLGLGEVLLPLVTAARELTDAERAAGHGDRAGQIRRLPINLASPGTMRVPAAAAPGTWHLVIDPASAAVALGVTGDAGSVDDAAGGTATLLAGTQVIVDVVANPGSAPVVRVIGAAGGRTLHGDLVGADTGASLPHAITGFSALALEAPEKTASFAFEPSHAGRIVPGNHASTPIVATIPTDAAVPYPVGTVLSVEQTGAAAVSIAPDSGVTCPPLTGRTLAAAGQGSLIGVRKRAADVWRPIGDFAAS